LPELNPYIPDDFSLIKTTKDYPHPELIVDEPTLRVVYTPSRYFASEPKADVSVVLRNPKAMDSAKNQVMFALNDYLAVSRSISSATRPPWGDQLLHQRQ
jgi:protease-3